MCTFAVRMCHVGVLLDGGAEGTTEGKIIDKHWDESEVPVFVRSGLFRVSFFLLLLLMILTMMMTNMI